jgi:lipooligosaccharide transport system ATP-binding protein
MAAGFFFAMNDVIIARDATKSYAEVEAVRGVSFDVRAGECYGLLGPSGAGKTTTLALIRCVSTLDTGQLKVLGRDVRRHARQIRSRLGVVPQEDNLDPDLSVLDNLRIYARYHGIARRPARERAEELLQFMALQDKAAVRIQQLSGGLRRRLLIARGLINQPELMVLDEPTTGLDPQARHLIWQRVRSLKATGTTMLLSTHSTAEAEQLCDRLAILDHGRILAEGRPADLIREHAGATVFQVHDPKGGTSQALAEALGDSLPQQARLEHQGDTLICYLPADQPAPVACIEAAAALKVRVTTRPASLEDVFLGLTGRELRE